MSYNKIKKPEKKLEKVQMIDWVYGTVEEGKIIGYNQACDDWEKYHKYIIKNIYKIYGLKEI